MTAARLRYERHRPDLTSGIALGGRVTGAESLARTLAESGVDACFVNPGTTEIHVLAALAAERRIRCVPALYENVATGAADGYYRIAGKPAATLLHLGPGLANGLANLHNAKKARSGIVNLVGEHATYHVRHAPPLASDIAAIAAPMSDWVRVANSAQALAADAADAIAAARRPPGGIATLIVPADVAWSEMPIRADTAAARAAPAVPPAAAKAVSKAQVRAAAAVLRGGPGAALLLGGACVREPSLALAGRIAAQTGCRLIAEGNNACFARGAGRVIAERIPYAPDKALAFLAGTRQLVLANARTPVAFFAYPGQPGVLAPADCAITSLAAPEEDGVAALAALAAELGALQTPAAHVATRVQPALPSGAMSLDAIGTILGALIPEDAIVLDEAISSGRGFFAPTQGAAPHDWLGIMGGAIGHAMPAAIGAAVAAPGRKVIALEGDGSGLYAPQSLWTLAHENLDVTVLVFANRSYQILRGELGAAGLKGNARAAALLGLEQPAIDWVKLAGSMGVAARRATDCAELASALREGLATPGPFLVEAVL